MGQNLLERKRILIVDDEPDVLESLEELLDMCILTKASNFEEAKELIERNYFDIAILDIMGVDGYKLLELAKQQDIIPVMLTAHALSIADTKKSYKNGAASYIPKERMKDITIFLNDILKAKEQGKPFWWRWLDRFSSYYDEKFGADWKGEDKEFWEKFGHYI